MKRIILLSFLIYMTHTLFAQGDTTKKSNMKIGLGVSRFSSSGINLLSPAVSIFSPAYTADIVFAYKYHNVSLGAVFIPNMYSIGGYLWKYSTSWSYGLSGFLFHYRFIPFYQKRFSPVIGYNFNYGIQIDRGGTDTKIINYESVIKAGVQWRLSTMGILRKFFHRMKFVLLPGANVFLLFRN